MIKCTTMAKATTNTTMASDSVTASSEEKEEEASKQVNMTSTHVMAQPQPTRQPGMAAVQQLAAAANSGRSSPITPPSPIDLAKKHLSLISSSSRRSHPEATSNPMLLLPSLPLPLINNASNAKDERSPPSPGTTTNATTGQKTNGGSVKDEPMDLDTKADADKEPEGGVNKRGQTGMKMQNNNNASNSFVSSNGSNSGGGRLKFFKGKKTPVSVSVSLSGGNAKERKRAEVTGDVRV